MPRWQNSKRVLQRYSSFWWNIFKDIFTLASLLVISTRAGTKELTHRDSQKPLQVSKTALNGVFGMKVLENEMCTRLCDKMFFSLVEPCTCYLKSIKGGYSQIEYHTKKVMPPKIHFAVFHLKVSLGIFGPILTLLCALNGASTFWLSLYL